MALTTEEAIKDALATLPIASKLLAAVQGLPPKATRKFSDYGPIVDIVRQDILPLVDQIEADVAS